MREMREKATKTWVMALTSVASFMVALDALVVTTALSTIRVDLGASIEALEWTVNAYNPKSVSWTDDIVLPDGSLNLCARVHGG